MKSSDGSRGAFNRFQHTGIPSPQSGFIQVRCDEEDSQEEGHKEMSDSRFQEWFEKGSCFKSQEVIVCVRLLTSRTEICNFKWLLFCNASAAMRHFRS